MFRWKKWESALCPVCLQEDETMIHVFTCPHHSRQAVWAAQVELLCQWMLQANMAPDIIDCFIPTLLHHGIYSFSSHAITLCQAAALDQDAIGVSTLVGHLSVSWNPLQAHYYASCSSQWSVKLWAVQFCHQLLQLSHTIWCTCNEQVLAA